MAEPTPAYAKVTKEEWAQRQSEGKGWTPEEMSPITGAGYAKAQKKGAAAVLNSHQFDPARYNDYITNNPQGRKSHETFLAGKQFSPEEVAGATQRMNKAAGERIAVDQARHAQWREATS